MRMSCLAFAALVLFAVAPLTVRAQTPTDSRACAPRAELVSQLEKKYGETRRAAGLQSRGSVTEIYASPKTGTWTIIVTRPDGTACAVAAGEAWLEDTTAFLDAAPT